MSTDVLRFFEFQNKQLRTVGTFEEPWYCVDDLVALTGKGQVTRMVRPLKDTWKKLMCIQCTSQKRNLWFVNEAGFNWLVLRSRQACIPGTIANQVAVWVCETVLPFIRKKISNQLDELETQLEEANEQIQDVNDQIQDANEALGTQVEHLINARAECQFVEENRLYKVAFAIPSVRARGNRAYNYIKQQVGRFPFALVWRDNVPYIPRGRVDAVRAILS